MTDAPEVLARGIDQITYTQLYQSVKTPKQKAVQECTYDSAYRAAESEISNIYSNY